MKRIQHIDWELAARVHSGEASKGDVERFEKWVEDSENKAEWNRIQEKLGQVDHALVAEKVDVDLAWEKVKQQTTSSNRGVIKMLRAGYVAAAASVIIAVVMFLNPKDNSSDLSELLVAQAQESIEQVGLNDGSLIDLNRNSSIEYPEEFGENSRLVSLKGEAFFNVTADKTRPFIIDAGNFQVKVVGTSFNVKAYSESEYKEVSVKSGVVEVSSLLGNKPIVVLRAGDKAVFNINNNSLIKMESADENYMAWKTKEIIFKHEDLKAAILLLEDVYGVNIQVRQGKIEGAIINSTFYKKDINFIIEVIERMNNIDLELVEKE